MFYLIKASSYLFYDKKKHKFLINLAKGDYQAFVSKICETPIHGSHGGRIPGNSAVFFRVMLLKDYDDVTIQLNPLSPRS